MNGEKKGTGKSGDEIMEALAAPFELVMPDGTIVPDIKWLPSHKSSTDKIECIPYISGNQVRNRLNSVMGAKWTDRLEKHEDRTICTLSLLVEGDWMDRADVGTKTNVEAQKGEATDALKRAAKNWGVGAYLETIPSVIVDTKRISGKTVTVTPKGTPIIGNDLHNYINANMSLPMAKLIDLWKALSKTQQSTMETLIVKMKELLVGKPKTK